MKTLVYSVLFLSVAAFGAKRTQRAAECQVVKKAIERNLSSVSKYMSGGYSLLESESSEPIEMVKEFLLDRYSEPLAEGAVVNEDSDSVQMDETGTLVRQGAIDAILSNVREWYMNDLSDKEEKALLGNVQQAAEKLTQHQELKFGYDGGAQGWGGSPATELLIMNPRCKLIYSLFLGITEG